MNETIDVSGSILTDEQISTLTAAVKRFSDDVIDAGIRVIDVFRITVAAVGLARYYQSLEEFMKENHIYTAWQLAGDWWWTQEYRVRVVGGRTLYWEAQATRTGRVRLARLDPGQTAGDWSGIKQINRYIEPDTLCMLVPVEKENRHEVVRRVE